MDSYVNFNITGSMTFTNIDFTGENALAIPIDASSTIVTPPLATVPIKKCKVTTTTAPDGTYTPLKLETITSSETLISDKFKCNDSGF